MSSGDYNEISAEYGIQTYYQTLPKIFSKLILMLGKIRLAEKLKQERRSKQKVSHIDGFTLATEDDDEYEMEEDETKIEQELKNLNEEITE